MAFLQSERIELRPLTETDFELIASWLNDGEVTTYMFYGQRPQSVRQVKEWIEEDLISEKNIILMIVDKVSGETIGFTGYYGLHFTARKGELRILLGDKSVWGRGYGTEVIELMTFYGFDRLNLERVYLGCTADNKRAEGAYIKAGFKLEGRAKHDIYRNSQYYDAIHLGLIREDYYKELFEAHKKRFSNLNSI